MLWRNLEDKLIRQNLIGSVLTAIQNFFYSDFFQSAFAEDTSARNIRFADRYFGLPFKQSKTFTVEEIVSASKFIADSQEFFRLNLKCEFYGAPDPG